MNVKAGLRATHPPSLPLSLHRQLCLAGSNPRIVFYENNDYDFPIIVSLIVSSANTVTKTKIARSILAADSAKNGTLFT